MPSAQWKLFNCYNVLEVSPAASPQEIRTAYKQAGFHHHPDRGGSHEAQVRINIAYEVLSNPIERQSHDLHWRISQSGSFGSATKSSVDAQTKEPETGARVKYDPLGGFRRRVFNEIEMEKEKIWQDLKNRAQKNEVDFLKQYASQRRNATRTFIGLITVSVLALLHPVFWVGVFTLGFFCLSTMVPVRIGDRTFSIFHLNASHNLLGHAYEMAKQSCVRDMNKVGAYLSSLAFISQLLLRPSTLDNSEEHVARRLTASFFLMGYIPLLFDRKYRTLTFTDGDEKIIVRFRHRDGRPINISYVEKLVELMAKEQIKRGFLFCSPGLSENADHYARQKNITWYQLESMNEW